MKPTHLANSGPHWTFWAIGFKRFGRSVKNIIYMTTSGHPQFCWREALAATELLRYDAPQRNKLEVLIMAWSPPGTGKTPAQRQKEYRERRKAKDSEHFLVGLYARELHRALKQADDVALPVPGAGVGRDPAETLQNLASYYLAESQAARMEEFAMRAGNNKTAAPRKRRAAV